MILRYERLKGSARVFKAMTGLTVEQFDRLVTETQPRLSAAEVARKSRPERRRAIGGGHPFELSVHDQVLLTVIWLRQSPTYEILAYLFDVSKPTASRTIGRILPLLEASRGPDESHAPTGSIIRARAKDRLSNRRWRLRMMMPRDTGTFSPSFATPLGPCGSHE